MIIGYFDFFPQIGFMELKRTTDGIIKQASYNIKANAIGAGTDPYFVNSLSKYTYPDTESQAINTVRQAITLDHLKPKPYWAIGGKIQDGTII